MRNVLLSILLLLVTAGVASGFEAQPPGEDPAEAQRAARIAAELRCLVCQNQSIADSNAELATDLRRQIREQLAQGRSDRQIIDYMVERYGDFVLYRPPFKATTALLWGGPALLLVLGAIVLGRSLAGRRVRAQEPLTDEERARAQALLTDEGERRP